MGFIRSYRYSWDVKKIAIGILTVSLLSSIPAYAAKTVPYKNQKEGESCNLADAKKVVTLPNGKRLLCKRGQFDYLTPGLKPKWIIYITKKDCPKIIKSGRVCYYEE
jgi:hypothetical protein